jgi:glycine cleavage system H protein
VRYTNEHEWIAQHADGVSFVGITKYAADALGDATFVELPEVGDELTTGDSMGSVESVKSSSEIYSPVNGEVIEVNETLNDSPQLINQDPMGEGWLAKIKTEGKLENIAELLTEEEYHESLKEEDH